MGAIESEALRKAYGTVQALDGVSLLAESGDILALLGPNGSGKTTLVRVLTTQVSPDSGRARVAERDVVREGPAVREVIGVTAQETHIDRFVTGEEYLTLVARLRHIPRRRRVREVRELLEEFDLTDVARRRAATYSGGLRRRLDIAATFIGTPRVLFLDEPATGLDPDSRVRLWEAIRRRAHDGAAVLLTTQYMDEADALATGIIVLAHGRAVARGTPEALKDRIHGRFVTLTLAHASEVAGATSLLATLGIAAAPRDSQSTLEFVLLESHPRLPVLVRRLDDAGVRLGDLFVRRPTLDEAFRRLTGDIRAVQQHAPHPIVRG